MEQGGGGRRVSGFPACRVLSLKKQEAGRKRVQRRRSPRLRLATPSLLIPLPFHCTTWPNPDLSR